MTLRIVNWNLKWADPHGWKGQELTRRIGCENPEVVCLTEAPLGFLAGGHVIAADADYGYRNTGDRRKVQLWSRSPWVNVDAQGDPCMPTGRFIRGTTETSLGKVTFVGVCVPWNLAHVTTGRGDRRSWEDHIAYLGGLPSPLKSSGNRRMVLLGDFNQRIPRSDKVPLEVAELLSAATQHLKIARTDRFKWQDEAIDHVFHSDDLRCGEVRLLDNSHPRDDLSDHVGWSVLLAER